MADSLHIQVYKRIKKRRKRYGNGWHMLQPKATAPDGQLLSDHEIRNTLSLLERQFINQRVLVLIPDHTRSLPLPFLFRSLGDTLDGVKQLDFMVALGTHPPLSRESIQKLVGITAEE